MSPSRSYKLALPDTARHLPRPRQIHDIEALFRGATVVWLTGLPGAGKTSLAAQWVCEAQARGERCLWYRLDEDDADIAGLFDTLRRHPSHEAGAQWPLPLPAWSPENQPELAAFTRNFVASLAQGGPLTLVFDDCHRVSDDSPFFEMVDAARELGPARVRILMISRRRPAPRLDRGVLAGWLAVYDDLALTMTEATELAQRVSGRAWTPAQAETLRSTDGWLAHVLAMARGATAAPALPLDRTVAARVGEYLAMELLLMLPATDRRALRLLAELPEIPPALVQAGRVPPRVAAFLHELSAAGYFIDTSASGAWRMHDLLREGLRAQNALAEDPPELRAERAALAACIAGEAPDVAMNLFVSAQDTGSALGLLRRHGRDWFAQGRHRQLCAWLEALPALAPDTPPAAELTLWRAESLLPLEPESARPLFARSRAVFVRERDAHAAYRAWCGEVASYVVQWGAVQGLAELVDELETMEGVLGAPPGDWRFRTAADALTALMYGRAEDPRLRRYADETALAVEQAPDRGSSVMAAAQLMIYRMWWTGDYPGARALYDAFDLQVERDPALAPLPRLLWWSNSAIVDWTCGDPARCYDKVDRGLALAESSGVHVRDFFLLTQGIFCALAHEDMQRARGYLDRLATTAHGQARLDVMVHHFFRCWYGLSQGDPHTALAHAEAALVVADAIGSLFHKVIVLAALGPARLHTGDVSGAQEAYRQQIALAKLSDNLPFTYIAFCTGAEIALMTGDEAALRKQLERILTVKRLGGFHSDCGWRSGVRARMLAFALEHELMPDVARLWIREKRLTRPAGCSVEWPTPVQLRALRGLTVEVDRPTAEAEAEAAAGTHNAGIAGTKPAAKLRELLAVLVAQRGGALKEDLCDWLWPQADGDKAAASLKACVHRLRAWLGTHAVSWRDGVLSLNEDVVGCDLWRWLDAPDRLPPPRPHEVLAGFHLRPVLALRKEIAQRMEAAHI